MAKYPIPPDLIAKARQNLEKQAFMPMQDPAAAAAGAGAAAGAPPAGGAPPGMDTMAALMGGGVPPGAGAPPGAGPMGMPPDLMSLLGGGPPAGGAAPPAGGEVPPSQQQNQVPEGGGAPKSKTLSELSEDDFESLVKSTVSDVIDKTVSDLTSALRELKDEIADLKSQLTELRSADITR